MAAALLVVRGFLAAVGHACFQEAGKKGMATLPAGTAPFMRLLCVMGMAVVTCEVVNMCYIIKCIFRSLSSKWLM